MLTIALACSEGHPSEHPSTVPTVSLRDTDDGYTLYRNGSPFQIVGAGGEGRLAELKLAGGNTLRVYSPHQLSDLLDEAEALGIAIIADLPLPPIYPNYNPYEDSLTAAGLVDTVRTVVGRFADHPALLCWMLGNEVVEDYSDDAFAKTYSRLVATVRETDPNHPITTAMIPRTLITNAWRIDGLGLDFVSLNTFGNLQKFDTRKLWLMPLWRGPYLLSEWSVNGPWESEYTSWGAPIESTSAKKAEQIRERYLSHIASIDDDRCLGSLAFYWGQKQERTHTWFSLFDESGRRSEMTTVLGELWRGVSSEYLGPRIEYVLLEEQGAQDHLILLPGVSVSARAVGTLLDTLSTRLTWEVRPEDWYAGDKRGVDAASPAEDLLCTGPSAELFSRFKTPRREGPYRLFVKATDTCGHYATANIPFQVIGPDRAD